MSANFVLSGFSDEISPDIKEQFHYFNELGIKFFEIRGVNEKNVSELTESEAIEVKKLADSCGIGISSIGSPVGKIKANEPFEPHIELLNHIIKLAKIFETKFIRVFSFYIPEGEDAEKYRDEVIRRMKIMAEIAQEEDVILLHENEKGIFGDVASRCKDILDAVNSPNLRAVFDPANFVECDQITYPDSYEILKDYLAYIHIKDSVGCGKIVAPGKGNGKIKEILSELKKSGYNGFVSLEPHLHTFEGLKNLQSEALELEEELSGPDAFRLAHSSLLKIISEI